MSPQLPAHVPSRAHAIIITCVIGPIVSTAIVSTRVWTRVVVTRNLGWDDYAAMVTLLFCIGFSVVLGISTRYGMGLHLWDVRLNLWLSTYFQLGVDCSCRGTCLLGKASFLSSDFFHTSMLFLGEEMLTSEPAIDDTGAGV